MSEFEPPHHLHHFVAEVVDDLDGDTTRAVDLIGFSEGDLVLEKNHHWLLQILAQTIGALANKEIPFFPSS